MSKFLFGSLSKTLVVALLTCVVIAAVTAWLLLPTNNAQYPADQLVTTDVQIENELKLVQVTLDSQQSNQDYLLHFLDADSDEKIAVVFVKRGSLKVVSLPVGDYHIKFASGAQWQDEQSLFGADTDIRQTQIPMKLTARRSGASYNVIRLNTKFIGQLQPAKM
ncbi:hypothetical protein JYB87_02740 [Shewanella avicenniae]|uniref:Uncharacterized protein n=1 Tax=Shewanella avicenniae TaxID=2814294 RepID=A0ABX7QTL8_9GAMM|nr:hypothetical protein [Shewanella avicenniae]QSX34183.1 hypothetical protein JYB87_02740 [Shewanella avicenniae]